MPEISTTQTPKDMVFSETSHKTQSLLKVVEIDRLKPNKNPQNGGLTGGVISDTKLETAPCLSAPTTSFSEEYLKPEPLFESTMFPAPDYEFFQDLGWSSVPVRDAQAQITDVTIKKTEERANTYDTTNTPFSPQGWDANSPLVQTSFYGTSTPKDSLSPADGFSKFDFLYPQEFVNDGKMEFSEQFQNLQDLPVVVLGEEGNFGSENMCPVANTVDWSYTQTTQYKQPNIIQTMPFIDQEDSLNLEDLKFTPVMPRDVENNDVVISEFVVDHQGKAGVLQGAGIKTHPKLSVDLIAAGAPNELNINTPDVVNYVDMLETEKSTHLHMRLEEWLSEETEVGTRAITPPIKVSSPVHYSLLTPKDESLADSESDTLSTHLSRQRRKRSRLNSEDSDETYIPPSKKEKSERKKTKPNIKEIKEIINSQKPPRRGRPPKVRRESTFSSVGSVDDNSSNISTQELKYRELRDKNNEASKRSRMNRKLKELEMERLAEDLVEQNKKLQVKVNILEEMTVKLKNALMAAMTQK